MITGMKSKADRKLELWNEMVLALKCADADLAGWSEYAELNFDSPEDYSATTQTIGEIRAILEKVAQIEKEG